MSSFNDSNIISEIFKIFKVKKVVACSVSDKNLINEIKKCNLEVTLINIDDKNSIRDNPLNVLPDLQDYDAIFLDGDANWYTVFNELNIIKKSNKEFPLVLICNNTFPNKRRDSYINPNAIPNEFRQKYIKTFPIYCNDKKIDISDGFFHACDENTPKNGVLTAIEDFLGSNLSIGNYKINLLNEITILYQKIPINQKRVDIIIKNIQNDDSEEINLSDKLTENQLLISYINKYNIFNENFNEYEVELSKKDAIIKDFENKLRHQDLEINHKDSQIKTIESKLSLKDSQIKNFESKLLNKEKEISNLEHEITTVNVNSNERKIDFDKRIDFLENNLIRKNDELDSLKNTLNQKEQELNNPINNEIRNIQQIDTQLKTTQQELDNKEIELKLLQKCYTKQLSKIDNKEYCINCFKEEISNNQLEIQYLQNNILIKKILSPIAYLFLIVKSSPKEWSLNIKLYQTLKNSNCFDIGLYLNKNSDLLESIWCKYFSPELHYVCNGFDEERIFNKKYFDRRSKKDLLEYLLKCEK